MRTMNEAIAAISDWIDEAPANATRDPEARTWGRLSKVFEEGGEVVSAYIGMTGQNPRKGITHNVGHVEEELLDVALTALAAYFHLSRDANVIETFDRFVEGRCERVGL